MMSSYRGEGRKSGRASGSRFRDDVRLGNKSEDSRRFEGYRRGRGGLFNHPDMENGRKVIVSRDDSVIIRVTNDLYQDPNSSNSRRSQASNRSSATLSQPRNRFEATGTNRSRPFREGAFNGLEQPALSLDWKPDASTIPVYVRLQAGLRGNSGKREFPPVWASGDGNRSAGFRRGGGGVGTGSGRIRRRGGSGDGTKTPFRARDELVSDRDKEIGEMPRGGLRRRGGPQGLRSRRRGGAIRGSAKFFRENTRGAHGNRLDVEETENVESVEDSNSTDDYQYRSNVDLKEADNLRRVCEDPVQREGTEEHVNGGLNIVVGSHQDESVDSRQGEESEEELEDEDEAEHEESFKVADGGSESNADGDTSEKSKEETQASEVLENESTSKLTTLEANKAEDIDKDLIVSDGSNQQEKNINFNAVTTSDGDVRQTVMPSPPRDAGVKAEESSTE